MTPLTVKEICPFVAPIGTIVVKLVVVEERTTASVPLNLIMLSVGFVLKLVPLMVIVAPTAPLLGVKLVMLGEPRTVNESALVIVTPLVVTDMVPEPAPEGTVTVILVELEAVTTALMPLNATTGDGPKFVPVIITVAPVAPLVGLKLVIVGVGSTVKVGLAIVWPFTETLMGPVVAPGGTTVLILLLFGRMFTEELTPLKNWSDVV